ncbi:hypothetical protein [Heyndrickxia ginsengihumi]|uniref:defense against restriction DarA-related protein n=1 Tax=Heyndrickxia ginsengihumi TaxID=363870 RepID=UPI000470BE38|nr:hypothetical protein [Heyndrickxia ginsengihumi]
MNGDEKKYWYSLKIRGISKGTQPEGYIDIDKSKGKWGSIAYNRPLTEEELDHFDLVPLKQKEDKVISFEGPKYTILRSDRKKYEKHWVYRIQALKGFGDVKAGELGGYIESDRNLSHNNNSWVYDNAVVFGNSKVKGNSVIKDYAVIKNSHVSNTTVKGKSILVDSDVYDSTILDYSYIDNATVKKSSLSDRVFISGDREKALLIGCQLSQDVNIDGQVKVKNSILENTVSIEGDTILDSVSYSDNRKIVDQEVMEVSNKLEKNSFHYER